MNLIGADIIYHIIENNEIEIFENENENENEYMKIIYIY